MATLQLYSSFWQQRNKWSTRALHYRWRISSNATLNLVFPVNTRSTLSLIESGFIRRDKSIESLLLLDLLGEWLMAGSIGKRGESYSTRKWVKVDGDLFNLSTYRLSHNSSTCSYIMKAHWPLRHVPLEKKCGFTLLLLRLYQCERYLCISSFSGKRTDKTMNRPSGRGSVKCQIGSIGSIVHGDAHPDAGWMDLGLILERQVERQIYSNGTLSLPLTLDTSLDATLDARCVYTLSLSSLAVILFRISIMGC